MVGEKTEDKTVGRTRGGLNTKLHAIVDGLGNPVEFLLSAGNDNDCVHAVELLENVELCGSNVLADRAYPREIYSANRTKKRVPFLAATTKPGCAATHLQGQD